MFDKLVSSGSHLKLRVELQDITPAIWRRFIVPADARLDLLHAVLQIAFGWKDCHLHDFLVGDIRFGLPHVEDEMLVVDERGAPLGAVARYESSFLYRYDFGDGWEHEITVEDVLPPTRDLGVRLECLDGARACPPEDCGGPPGYENLLRVLADPRDEEHRDLKRWVGRGFDPERFEIEKVQKKLSAIAKTMARATRRR